MGGQADWIAAYDFVVLEKSVPLRVDVE